MLFIALYFVSVVTASIARVKMSRVISAAKLSRGYLSRSLDADLAEMRDMLATLHYPDNWKADVLAYIEAAHKNKKIQKMMLKQLMSLNTGLYKSAVEEFLLEHDKVCIELVESIFPEGIRKSKEILEIAVATARKDIRKMSGLPVSAIDKAHSLINILRKVSLAGDRINESISNYILKSMEEIGGDDKAIAKALLAFDRVDHTPSEAAFSLYIEANHAFNVAVAGLSDKSTTAQDLRRRYFARELASLLDYAEKRRISLFSGLAGKLFEKRYAQLQAEDEEGVQFEPLLRALAEQTSFYGLMNTAHDKGEVERKYVSKALEEICWFSDTPRVRLIPTFKILMNRHYETSLTNYLLTADEARTFTQSARELALLIM